MRYGARGITVCDRWRGENGFENFLSDMGPRPEGMTLDRKESNGNYEPGNCKWATKEEQAHNRGKFIGACKYKGVTPSGRKFIAAIYPNGGKRVYLGTHDSEITAASAVNTALKMYYGESAKLNEIPEPTAA